MDTTENTNEAMLESLLNKILGELNEHFDACQILVTRIEENGNTASMKMGIGNWYARQGVAREFLEMDAAQTMAQELKNVIPRPDDGDDWKS